MNRFINGSHGSWNPWYSFDPVSRTGVRRILGRLPTSVFRIRVCLCPRPGFSSLFSRSVGSRVPSKVDPELIEDSSIHVRRDHPLVVRSVSRYLSWSRTPWEPSRPTDFGLVLFPLSFFWGFPTGGLSKVCRFSRLSLPQCFIDRSPQLTVSRLLLKLKEFVSLDSISTLVEGVIQLWIVLGLLRLSSTDEFWVNRTL